MGSGSGGPLADRPARRGRRHGRWLAGGAAALVVVATGLIIARMVWPPGTNPWIDTGYGKGGAALVRGTGTGAGTPPTSVDASGRLLVTTADPGKATTGTLTRLDANGVPDPAFGTRGAARLPVLPDAIHADAGGTVSLARIPDSGLGVTVSRLSGTGALDPGFGSAGQTTVLPGQHFDVVLGMTQRRNGDLVLALLDQSNLSPVMYLVAFTATGGLDASWAPGGTVPGVLQVNDALFVAIAADGDDIVVAGSAGGTAQSQVALRYRATGTADPAFGTAGQAALPAGFQAGDLMVAGAGGPYYLAGADAGTTSAMAVVKLLGTGTPDPSFGTGGEARGPASGCTPQAHRGFLTPAGLYLVGRHDDCGASAVLADRFTPSGTLDTGFGTGGELAVDQVRPGRVRGGGGAGVQPDGRVLVFFEGTFGVGISRLRTTTAPGTLAS